MVTIISGSCGYIASNLMRHLPEAIGYDVKDNYNSWDFLEYHQPELIYHLGALSGIRACEDDPHTAIHLNVDSTLYFTELAGKMGAKIVFASSEAVNNPTSLYAQTKLIGETLVLKAGGIVCRIGNVYGGDNYTEKKDTVVARLMKGTFEERGDDYKLRDFIHVDEVCKGLIEASTKPSGVYSLNTGKRTSIITLKEMAEMDWFPSQLRRPYKLTKII